MRTAALAFLICGGVSAPLAANGPETPIPSSCEIAAEGSLSTNPDVRFELEAEKEDEQAEPEGHLAYSDPRVGLRFRSARITSVQIRGTRATVGGKAQAEGATLEFEVEVEDRSRDRRPGHLRIQLSSGYRALGDIEKGRVELECDDDEGEERSLSEAPLRRPDSEGKGPSRGFLRQLGRDFSHLKDRDNLLVLATGGALSLAVHAHDREITRNLAGSPAMDAFFELGAVGGGGLVQVGGAIATYVVGRAAGNQEVRSLGGDLIRAQVVSGALTQSLKLATSRTRPDGSNQRSFPSGHSSATFATATVLGRRYGWKVGLPAYAFASYVAGSRLQENKHYASDVLLGAALGIAGGRSVTFGRGRVRASLLPLPAPDGIGIALAARWR